jgi:hypothetical protein
VELYHHSPHPSSRRDTYRSTGENSPFVQLKILKRLLGRRRRRWVDNIRMDLGEVGWGGVDCIGLAQARNRWRALVNSVLNLRVP